MSTWTIRLPDDKHERRRALAKSHSISIDKLMGELATVALATHDARVRFETRAARRNAERALSLLDKLDRASQFWLGAPARECRNFCRNSGD